MKPLSEQNHYEILEVVRDAAPEEIERSYRMARATYAEDSLAGYSVFGEGDADALRERIDIAYRVLSDPELRRSYDESLRGSEERPAESPLAAAARQAAAVVRAAEIPDVDTFEEFDADEGAEFDGPRLRRSRMNRGMEIEEIAGVTKINPMYLRFIEEERFDELPAPVYVRGFVSAYATCVGIDSKRAAASYMKKFRVERPVARRTRHP